MLLSKTLEFFYKKLKNIVFYKYLKKYWGYGIKILSYYTKILRFSKYPPRLPRVIQLNTQSSLIFLQDF